jgi:hypothetical protein
VTGPTPTRKEIGLVLGHLREERKLGTPQQPIVETTIGPITERDADVAAVVRRIADDVRLHPLLDAYGTDPDRNGRYLAGERLLSDLTSRRR